MNTKNYEIDNTTSYQIPKIINGCWQLTYDHNYKGYVDKESLTELILKYLEAGFYAFDCADIYQGVEEILGYTKSILNKNNKTIKIHTKYVPDLNKLEHLKVNDIRQIIERSCKRLQSEHLDLVQFHWWDYQLGDYIAALKALNRLRLNGQIKLLGLTNFNTQKLQEILDTKIPITSIQIQCSLLDSRADKGLISLCKKHGIKVFAYGSLCGGFLSEKWIGISDPAISKIQNRSLIKYKAIIDQAGGWKKFQILLKELKEIATRHNTSIYKSIVTYMLDHSGVDSIILGITNRFLTDRIDILPSITFSDKDLKTIRQLKNEFVLPGDVYDLERDREGPHGKIMKYNLSQDT